MYAEVDGYEREWIPGITCTTRVYEEEQGSAPFVIYSMVRGDTHRDLEEATRYLAPWLIGTRYPERLGETSRLDWIEEYRDTPVGLGPVHCAVAFDEWDIEEGSLLYGRYTMR